MRSPRSAAERSRGESGSAVVDFVLVTVVLVPLFLGIVQVALVLHVRNTLTAAATEGARHGATLDRGPGHAADYTRQQVSGILADRFTRDVHARETRADGVEVVEVTISAEVPPLGLWGPAIRIDVQGHAIVEQAPAGAP